MAYTTPDEVKLENGKTLAQCMPGNLGGVVVRPATATGRIVGAPADPLVFNVMNSDGSGTAKAVPLSILKHPDYLRIKDEIFLEVPGSDIESVRERAARVIERMAALVDIAPSPTVSPQCEEEKNADDVSTPAKQDVEESNALSVDRGYSPMAALGLSKKKSRPVFSEDKNVLQQEIGPPTHLAYFEKEGVGTVPAFFHAVVANVEAGDDVDEKTGFLVLIYDLRYPQNAARWFPPSFDPYGRPWAVKIQGDSHVYLVTTTGFQYVYDGREHCILAVERAVMSSEV